MIKSIRAFFADPARVSKLLLGLSVALGLGSVVVLAGAFILL